MQYRSASKIKGDLRKLSLAWKSKDEIEASLESTHGESDRGFMILVVTQLEDMLTAEVAQKLTGMTSEERDSFLGPDGVASAFGIKIKLALGLGVIDRGSYTHLELIRSIRNACAHAIRPVSFDTPIIKEAVLSFVTEESRPSYANANADVLRPLFWMMCTQIVATMAAGGNPVQGIANINTMLQDPAIKVD